jgi:hypothetical protein
MPSGAAWTRQGLDAKGGVRGSFQGRNRPRREHVQRLSEAGTGENGNSERRGRRHGGRRRVGCTERALIAPLGPRPPGSTVGVSDRNQALCTFGSRHCHPARARRSLPPAGTCVIAGARAASAIAKIATDAARRRVNSDECMGSDARDDAHAQCDRTSSPKMDQLSCFGRSRCGPRVASCTGGTFMRITRNGDCGSCVAS